jgi:hypothetical protein
LVGGIEPPQCFASRGEASEMPSYNVNVSLKWLYIFSIVNTDEQHLRQNLPACQIKGKIKV